MVNFYTPPKKSLSSKALTVTVHSLDAFGQGVASHKGKTIFVKSALPDETVDITLTEEKKNYAKATVIKYHNYSSERTEPQCRYYGRCGGCEMQHVSSHLQHQAKYDALIKLLQKEAGAIITATSDPQIITSSPYHYRRRARLSIYWEKNKLSVGFRKTSSKQIINIEQCAVLVPQLNDLLVPLQRCLQQIQLKKALGHIELIAAENGVIVILRHTSPLSAQDSKLLSQFAEQQNVTFYLHGDTLVHLVGQTEHYYLVNNLKLTFSPLDFIQVNGTINQLMVATALNWLDLTPTDNVLDLFCGMGNFSLPLATQCQTVTGVEGVEALVAKAQLNTIFNQDHLCAQTRFIESNLEDNSQCTKWSIPHYPNMHNVNHFNKVLLDPARTGAFNAIATIVKISPARIVYISCNPATLARDSKLLIEAGYEIARVAILDMFPQTKHIESILLFIKSGS